MTRHEAILFSVRPRFAQQILDGRKTTELRRVRPDVTTGQRVLIYSSSPTRALLGTAVIHAIEAGTPHSLWPQVRDTAGVTRAEYRTYFAGSEIAVAISLRDVRALKRPLSLDELRAQWPWFRPPQSYCFVHASFHRAEARLKSLQPRAFGRLDARTAGTPESA
jgi:predicted transcriptional regulator